MRSRVGHGVAREKSWGLRAVFIEGTARDMLRIPMCSHYFGIYYQHDGVVVVCTCIPGSRVQTWMQPLILNVFLCAQ